MEIITILNQKGGVLKTTLTANLGSLKAKQGKKALLIDMDQSANLPLCFGTNAASLDSTLAEVLIDDVELDSAILKNIAPNLDILPSNKRLKTLLPLVYQNKRTNPVKTFAKLLSKLEYDYIFIDSAPELDLLTIAQMRVANLIVIPVQPETMAVKGLVNLNQDLKELVPDTKVLIVPTLVDIRTNIHKRSLKLIKEFTGKSELKHANSYISRSIRSAASMEDDHLPLVLTKSKAKNVDEYRQICKQI